MIKKTLGMLLVLGALVACNSKTENTTSTPVDSAALLKKQIMAHDSAAAELQKHKERIDSMNTVLDNSLNDIK